MTGLDLTSERAVRCGRFVVLPARKLVLNGDTPLRLGARAVDILLALISRPGQLVSKAELIATAWPESVVCEANLRVQVSSLRKALGSRENDQTIVESVPRQGYRISLPVVAVEGRVTPRAFRSIPTVEIHFADYCFRPAQRQLTSAGRHIRLGERANIILRALIESAGTVVSKNELLARAWPDMAVDECNLRFQITTLRKFFGETAAAGADRIIVNASGRGYCFAAPIEIKESHTTVSMRALNHDSRVLEEQIGA